jgi:hypothetical protein
VPRVATAVLFTGTVTRDDLKQCAPTFAGDDASDFWNEMTQRELHSTLEA